MYKAMIQRYSFLGIFLAFTIIGGSCQQDHTNGALETEHSLYQKDNLIAWCVVPFDKEKRSPEARAKMLATLGFTKFAYDWRDEHLPNFPQEVEALRANKVQLEAVWWWIDGQSDSLLNEKNQQLLHYLDSLKLDCDIWMSFDDRFFQDLSDSAKLIKAVTAITTLHQKASSVNARLQLYNHGEWFGDPRNQLAIIEQTGLHDIGLVYNFHHAHQQLEDFPELLQAMLPYLNTVNINGMKPEGPKILTVGQGSHEKEMLRHLLESGYQGNIGIIGHIENEDVELVLARNLQGLKKIAGEL